MTYAQWAGEYLESAEKIKSRIECLRREQRTADPGELKALDWRISVLYGMYLDCMHTAEILNRRKGEV